LGAGRWGLSQLKKIHIFLGFLVSTFAEWKSISTGGSLSESISTGGSLSEPGFP
jgi:hypothetical protein